VLIKARFSLRLYLSLDTYHPTGCVESTLAMINIF